MFVYLHTTHLYLIFCYRMAEENHPSKSFGCYRYFGVRSHLHHFYDYDSDADQLELLTPRKDKRCSPILWKIILWFGVTFLTFGGVLMLISHFGERSSPYENTIGDGRYAILDRRALTINNILDALGIVGIVMFCVGGCLVVVAVLLQTACNRYCFEDQVIDGSRKGTSSMPSISGPAPYLEVVENVQPTLKPPPDDLSERAYSKPVTNVTE